MKLLLTLTLLSQLLIAAPAFQGKRTFTQPDGTVINYQNRGDEYLHYAESDDGEILLYNPKTEQMEHVKIQNDALKPNGEAYTKNPSQKAKSRSRKQPKINKESLKALHDLRKTERHSHKKSTHKAE